MDRDVDAGVRSRRAVAEFLGTALLVATVVGSGIMAERLAAGNVALALLANTLATAAVLAVLILAFGEISGAHLNPVVSLGLALEGRMPSNDALVFAASQVVGALAGVLLANAMFDLPALATSTRVRGGFGPLLGEVVATGGLVLVIRTTAARHSRPSVALAVAGWIAAAYWFTPSTSFANPAVTLARSLTESFAGIRPADVPGFVAAQSAGALMGFVLARWLLEDRDGG